MPKLCFWAASLLLLHTYFFYPLLLVAWDAVHEALVNLRNLGRARPVAAAFKEEALPRVTLVVSAYNEERCIPGKLSNSLGLDYPPDKLDILIGSDGSTDATEALVQRCRDGRVRLSTAPRSGKASVLNRCIPSAKGDIILLSDANTVIAPDAVRKLVRHFVQPEVGAVCGRLRLFNPTREEYEESAYWTYESLIKLYEGKRGAVMGANGGLYAIRRSLFEELPGSTIVDDFVIALRILDRGYHVRYEPEALASEETTEDYGREFARRARIAAGNFQSLKMVGRLLSPLRGFPAFAFWSHKLLRWCAPALMVLALLANAALVGKPFYTATFAAQLAFYAMAGLSRTVRLSGRLRRTASAASYFVEMNAAIALGFWRFLWKTQKAAWDRTAR